MLETDGGDSRPPRGNPCGGLGMPSNDASWWMFREPKVGVGNRQLAGKPSTPAGSM